MIARILETLPPKKAEFTKAISLLNLSLELNYHY